jgi:hypothetical protein
MRRWLLIQRDYGQLGNRLHTHANALAWCIENKVNLVNLSFQKYSSWFSSNDCRSVEIFISRKSRLVGILCFSYIEKLVDRLCRSDKWLKRLTKIMILEKKDSEYLSEKELNQSFSSDIKTKALLVRAWDFRCTNSLVKHQNAVREMLIPSKEFVTEGVEKITELRKRFDCVVGIHARRGDYINYLEGIHFHSWDAYKEWIQQAKGLLEEQGKGRVGFFLCSDDHTDKATFNGLPVTFGNSKSVMTDLHSLSLCDYNLGPPSSFGTWLSWYGKVPRLVIQKGLQIKSLSQFVTCSQC